MTKKFLNTMSIEEIKERLHNGEKIFNEMDENAYVKYVDGIGICKFRKDNDELLVIVIALTSFHHLYFEDGKEDYTKMLGCVGWFWDDEEDIKQLGIFDGKNNEYFCDNNGERWVHFQPIKKSELKFWEDNGE